MSAGSAVNTLPAATVAIAVLLLASVLLLLVTVALDRANSSPPRREES